MLCGSPVSDGGRGLKQERARALVQEHVGSPVSDGGRGLKPVECSTGASVPLGSPVSDGGRGLKQPCEMRRITRLVVRPSAMAGVD